MMTLTPIDIIPKQFEGEEDTELVPTDVEEAVVDKLIDHIRKVTTCQHESTVWDVINAGPKSSKAQMSVVKDVLQTPLTIWVKELISLSPSV